MKSVLIIVVAFCMMSFKDERNIINGLGEIMKLALVRSTELFNLLEQHGPRLVQQRFQVRVFVGSIIHRSPLDLGRTPHV